MTMDDELDLWSGFSRRTARAGGFRDRDIARMVKLGVWRRVRRGDYQLAPGAYHREDAHLVLVRSTIPRLGGSGTYRIISHGSAAVLHRLSIWNADLLRVHITRPGSCGLPRTGAVHPHRGQVADDEIVMIDGVAVTSVARTILDLSRAYGFVSGVVTADAALHDGVVTADELQVVVDRARRRRSAGVTPHVLAFADGLSESVGESRSRILLARIGVPRPALQRRIYSDSGAFLGRVDFDIEGMRTVGEFDGIRKYCRDLKPGESVEDVVVREKLREDAIRDTGRQMVRWTWTEADRDAVLLDRFGRAFARAGHPDWHPEPWLPWSA